MATRPLDALDSVDPREAWDHEAHDFTPWPRRSAVSVRSSPRPVRRRCMQVARMAAHSSAVRPPACPRRVGVSAAAARRKPSRAWWVNGPSGGCWPASRAARRPAVTAMAAVVGAPAGRAKMPDVGGEACVVERPGLEPGDELPEAVAYMRRVFGEAARSMSSTPARRRCGAGRRGRRRGRGGRYWWAR